MPLQEFCLGCMEASQLVAGPAPTHSECGWVAETLSSSSSSWWHLHITLPLPCSGPADFRSLKNSFVSPLHPSAYSLLTHPPGPLPFPRRVRCCCSCKLFAGAFLISEKYLKDLDVLCVYLQTLLTVSSSCPSHDVSCLGQTHRCEFS